MSKRFVRRGVSKFFLLPTAADYKSPTRAEIEAGVDLTDEIADLSGWMLENSSAATPDMGSTFEKNIPGLDSAADSSITIYEDQEGDTTEAALVKGTEGVFVIMRKGDVEASASMDSFPCRVASKGSEFSAGNDPARAVVSFTITEEPELDIAVPAVA